MHIKWIMIVYAPPIGNEGVDLGCDDRVNLLIGPNASGKSNFLRAIKSAWSGELGPPAINSRADGADGELVFPSDVFIDLSDDWPRNDNDKIITTRLAIGDNNERTRKMLDMGDIVPLLHIPATRVNLLPQYVFSLEESTIDWTEDDRTDNPMEALFDTDSGVFQGQYVEQTIDWLRGRMIGNRSQQLQLSRALQVGYSCARSICSEVIRGRTPHPFVERHRSREFSDPAVVVHHNMGIRTSDKDLISGKELDSPLYAGALSSGTQSTLLWVWALALKMASHYEWTEGWEKKPAILLIDEIENHLHPTWQRRVIPALLEHFPGLQIFATTHSPFVVAGLKAGQVHLLKRDGKGTITASTNERDIIGWTTDEILRTMMGVDEPTDQLTVDRANRLRQLREKETLTTEEESELNELRRQVNKDLLSRGGPLEVERERYADLMQDFLRIRQSELTQDGG